MMGYEFSCVSRLYLQVSVSLVYPQHWCRPRISGGSVQGLTGDGTVPVRVPSSLKCTQVGGTIKDSGTAMPDSRNILPLFDVLVPLEVAHTAQIIRRGVLQHHRLSLCLRYEELKIVDFLARNVVFALLFTFRPQRQLPFLFAPIRLTGCRPCAST